jgi:hypothetical protein
MAEVRQEPLLRRVLIKTASLPYVLWMAGLGAIVGLIPSFFLWLSPRPVGFEPILIVLLILACLGCFSGLFVVRAMSLPLLATFADVNGLNGTRAKPQGNPTESVASQRGASRRSSFGIMIWAGAGTLIGAFLASFLLTGHWFATMSAHAGTIRMSAIVSGFLCAFVGMEVDKRRRLARERASTGQPT